MSHWDTDASTHLDQFAAVLTASGVTALLEQQVAQVFRRNADAFDHQEGDTPLCLGITCAENIRTLIVRASVGAGSSWRTAGVSALSVE